jgi:non-specific serine/threonine protein kinase
MGVVYRARHLLLKDVVALKLMPRDLGASPDSLRRFMREGQAARRFRHPNAVAVYDLRLARDGTPYLALEYVPGWTLRVEMRSRGRFAPLDALAVVEPIAGVLDAAHAAGVVHRDLKPENVMLVDGPEGEHTVKVLDLGLAKIVESAAEGDPDGTFAGAVLGTPYYMSPEQWGAPPRDRDPNVDGRSDLYSLAIIAYELLAGAHPFAGGTVAEIRGKHLYATPPPLGDLAPGLPPGVDRAIARALSKDRADRQRTAGELARELRAVLGGDTHSLALTVVGAPEGGADAAEAGASLRDVPNNVPWPITAFVGRPREIAECLNLLGRARLVTLVGPGGVGKTRLAVETAVRSGAESPDGVWFVELDALGDPRLVAVAVATALGIEGDRGRDALSAVRERLAGRRALVVLDNCEHLVDAAASVAAALLRSCPTLRVLATSREPLGIAGEGIYTVPPLSLPEGAGAPLAEATTSDAARLFVERAGLASPGFALTAGNAAAVVALCRRLDGVPLAIELAAACARTLPVEQILARLDAHLDVPGAASRGVPERHRTLRGAIDWGYELLSPDERALLRRVSVFAGGWDADAAIGVGGQGSGDREGTSDSSSPTPGPGPLIPVLERLVDTSFVVADRRGDEPRYRMLETIRRYAAEKLAESGEEANLVARHRAWFLALAERAAPELRGPDAPRWHAKLAAEIDNLRAVLARCDERVEAPEEALRMCAALERFWFVRGHWSEGRRCLDRALANAAAAPAALRSAALNSAANLAANEGDVDEAVALYEESLAMRRRAGDPRPVANTLHNLAMVVHDMGDTARAEALYAESREIYRDLGDRQGVAASLLSLGVLAAHHGDHRRSTELTEESLAIFRELDEQLSVGLALLNLGGVACYRADYETARARLEECLAIANALGFKVLAATATEILGEVALECGDRALARRLLGEALAAQRELGSKVGVATALYWLACLAAATGEAERAVRLAAAADRVRAGVASLTALDRERIDRYLEPARSALGAGGVERAQRWAAETDSAAAVDFALDDAAAHPRSA